MTEDLREKDIAVLQAIQDGASTTSEIKEATTLTLREINYSINEYSLEELGLIQVERRGGREQREVNGHEQSIWKPKEVELTEQGIQKLAELDTEDHTYEDMTRRELVQEIQELEERITRLEGMFKDFRGKVMDRI